MFRPLRCLMFVAGLLGSGAIADAAETVPEWWSRLDLHDLGGASVSPGGRWVVVVFLSPECPVANADLPVLNALADEFSLRGFTFVGAYADPTLGLADLRRHAREHGLRFTTADDRAQRLVRLAGASYTPEVFVFTREGQKLYGGRIDDRVTGFGATKPAATQEDLRAVLTSLASGKAGPFPDRPGFGCAIPEPVRR